MAGCAHLGKFQTAARLGHMQFRTVCHIPSLGALPFRFLGFSGFLFLHLDSASLHWLNLYWPKITGALLKQQLLPACAGLCKM